MAVPDLKGVSAAEMLDQQSVDGLLHKWLDWWPDDVVRDLVPDTGMRSRLLADMPRLARAFYDEVVPVPAGWSSDANGYLQLSAAYDGDLRTAVERDWPVVSPDADHLSIVTAPGEVLTALVELEALIGHHVRRGRLR